MLSITEQKTLIPIYEAHILWIKSQELFVHESGAECLQQFQDILAQLGNIAELTIIDSFREKSLLLDSLR